MNSGAQHMQVIDKVTPIAVTSSTDATPIVVTATAHGLVTGDKVAIYGHATNVAANGIFHVTKVNANTFQLQNPYTMADVAGSGAGAGSGGVMYAKPYVVLAGSHNVHVVELSTSGSANMTVKFAGSEGMSDTDSQSGRVLPNLGGTASPTNPWKFLDFAERDGGGALTPGDTGLIWSGTDAVKSVELNVGGLQWLAVIVTDYSAGVLSARCSLYDNR